MTQQGEIEAERLDAIEEWNREIQRWADSHIEEPLTRFPIDDPLPEG